MIATNVRDGPKTVPTEWDAAKIGASDVVAAATIAASGTGRATKLPPGSAMTRPSAGGAATNPRHARGGDRVAGRGPRLRARSRPRPQLRFGGTAASRPATSTSDRRVFNRGGPSELDFGRGTATATGAAGRGYRPMAGDYGRGDHESEQFFAASGYGRGERGFGDYDRSQTPYGRDENRRTSFAAYRERGQRGGDFDPHYSSWRDRHMSDLDRDYDDYPARASVEVRERLHQLARDEAAKARPARPDPRAYGSRRQGRRTCRHRRQGRRRPDHPDEVGSGERRRAPFAELLRHRPGRGRPRDPRLLCGRRAKKRGGTKTAAARCSSARTRARWAPAFSIEVSRAPIAEAIES